MTTPTLPLRGFIQIRDVGIEFTAGRTKVEALRGFDLEIQPSQIVCLLGPSGCGKTTLLNAVAGFLPISSGSMHLDGRPISGPDVERGMVFQSNALFPWKTVTANVEFGLKMRGMPKAKRAEMTAAFLRRVGLAGFEKHYPVQLSGGMQQRVGLARVLINEPRVLLMDEPFGALDAQTRLMMQELLLEIWHELRVTVVFVTHDIDEALFLGDRVVVMTCRPAAIKEDIHVDLPRPRTAEVQTTTEFARLKRHCMALIREESMKVMGGPGHGHVAAAATASAVSA
ncbi:MAG TPA: ABC transporter ATP-binding protein [Tepidisphaeraceae bacterium]|nr:ABC transporter ATP-binding protein [Tepidisphaeraceae bacterium]